MAWLLVGLVGCARDRPSAAPLTTAAEPVSSSERAPAAAAASTSAATVKPASPRGKRALYRRSCELGSALACNELAILLIADPQQSWPLLERACSLGLGRGCANWGAQLLYAPNGSRERAMEVLTRACRQSDGYGCLELGNAAYADAERQGSSSYSDAFELYEQGCKLGSMDACCSEGWMLLKGQGTTRDPRRARERFRFACEQQAYAGCSALGYDLVDAASNASEQEEGARYLRLACEHDDAFGCFSLGALMLAHAGPSSVEQGLTLLKRSCALGSQNGCSYAATLEERLRSGASDRETKPED